MKWHPDNLQEGCRYRFRVRNWCGELVFDEGVFVRFSVEHGLLWAWFSVCQVCSTGIDFYEMPIDVGSIVEIEEIK